MTKYRWNAQTEVWEFYEEAWGGWCVLRFTPSDRSDPFTFAQGLQHIVGQGALSREVAEVVTLYDAAGRPITVEYAPDQDAAQIITELMQTAGWANCGHGTDKRQRHARAQQRARQYLRAARSPRQVPNDRAVHASESNAAPSTPVRP